MDGFLCRQHGEKARASAFAGPNPLTEQQITSIVSNCRCIMEAGVCMETQRHRLGDAHGSVKSTTRATRKGVFDMALQTTRWDVQQVLDTPEDRAAYVQAAIEKAGDDSAFIVKALGQVARFSAMATVARDADITREGLYEAIGEKGNPSFAAVLRLIRALGLEVKLQAADA